MKKREEKRGNGLFIVQTDFTDLIPTKVEFLLSNNSISNS